MSEPLRPVPVPSRPSDGGDRLDSWKEIAAHFGREVRTAQGWEKNEGLPVHRHLHARQGSVYAFKSELDAWREARKIVAEEPAATAGVGAQSGGEAAMAGEPASRKPSLQSPASSKLGPILAIALALIVAIGGFLLWMHFARFFVAAAVFHADCNFPTEHSSRHCLIFRSE